MDYDLIKVFAKSLQDKGLIYRYHVNGDSKIILTSQLNVDDIPFIDNDKNGMKQERKKLSAWRKQIYSYINKFLFDNKLQNINIAKNVQLNISNQTCRFCYMNVKKLRDECDCYVDDCYYDHYCDYCSDRSKAFKDSHTFGNTRLKHKPSYYKMYNAIELSTRSIKKSIRFDPEKTTEYKYVKSLLIIHNRKFTEPSLIGILPKDILYIIVNMLLDPISVRNGKQYRFKKIMGQ